MKKQEAINRARDFLFNLTHITLDEIDEDFQNTHKPYFIYMDSEIAGCFENYYGFKTKEEINEIISDQMSGSHHSKWDNLVIFDVKKNRIVKPHI